MSRKTETGEVTLPELSDTLVSRENVPVRSVDGSDDVCAEVPGRYEFTTGPDQGPEELGRGGMGRVMVALDHFVGREVAMKQLLTELTSNPQVGTQATARMEQRFLREARLTGQLEHPAIVPVYEIGRRNDGSFYYTMTRIRGRTLAEALRLAGSLEARLLLMPNVLTVCQAIAHAHERGVINRDIKPQNVMLGRFGVTYVLDWGLARAKDEADAGVRLAPSITQGLDANVVGTPSYMSPEQASGQLEFIDEQSDVWGLGATLYEVLTGRPPYTGRSPWEVIADIKTRPWTPVRELVPAAPPDLVAICEKALCKDRAQRYRSAAALVSDLESWLQGRRVGAYEYTSLELLSRFVRRQRVVLGVVVAAALALLVVGGVSYARIVEERNATRQFAQLLAGDLGRRLDAVPGARDAVGQMWKQLIDFYGRQPAVSPAEQDEVLQAWMRLGELQTSAGTLPEARQSLQRCVDLAPLDPPPARLARATAAVHCRTDLANLAALEGHAEESRRLYAALWAQVEPLEARFDDSAWKTALANVTGRLADAENLAGEKASARALASRGLALQERALQLAPTDPTVRRQTVLALQAMEVSVFTFQDPQVALAYGARAIALAQPLAMGHDLDGLRVLGSILRQHGMMLSWLEGREGESRRLLHESTERLGSALALEPGDVTTMGELADTWIELHEPAKALALLTQANALGVKGDYALSLGSAQALAGDLDAAKVTLEQCAPSRQAHLGLAIVAALAGHPAEAARQLRACLERPDEPTQWPRGAFGRLAQKYDSPSARVLDAFTGDYERAFVTDDDAQLGRALETAAVRFETLAGKP